jgi:hypothetical protein
MQHGENLGGVFIAFPAWVPLTECDPSRRKFTEFQVQRRGTALLDRSSLVSSVTRRKGAEHGGRIARESGYALTLAKFERAKSGAYVTK